MIYNTLTAGENRSSNCPLCIVKKEELEKWKWVKKSWIKWTHQKNKKEKAAKIIAEQKEKRNANTKYFLTENHGGVAAIYPYPVHYEEDGEWKDIDNGLQEENSQEEGYENKAARFKVKFAKYADAKKLVSVKLGEHKLSWGLEQETMAEEAEASAETGEEADSSKSRSFVSMRRRKLPVMIRTLWTRIQRKKMWVHGTRDR